MNVAEYQKLIKKERNLYFKSSFERAYQAFCELGLDRKESIYFEENASGIVENMREQCWNDFLKEESSFTVYMMKKLIPEIDYEGIETKAAIEHYLETFPDHIYALCLSNTQSRRSRAGKEFEHILELILMGANTSVDSQGNIGKDKFVEKGLGKLVDIVSPGVIEFEINKRKSVLISAKTTLRERWQEVPEEMGRTGAREMFLATLDEKATPNVLNALYEANIQLTTTKNIKENHYKNNDRVVTFEELIQICKSNKNEWIDYEYTIDQVEQEKAIIEAQISKHANHSFIKNVLEERIFSYINLLKD